MNNKLVSLLSLLCGLLVLVIAGEWWYAQHNRAELLSGTSSSMGTVDSEEMPSVDLAGQPEASYVDLVDRPLFIKGRRPVAELPKQQGQANAVAVKFDWLLVGVYTSEKKLQALLVRDTKKVPKDNYRKLPVGSILDGWTLSKIDKDQVVFSQDGSEKILQLRKPKAKQEANKTNNPNNPEQQQPEPEEINQEVPSPEFEPEPTEEPIENE